MIPKKQTGPVEPIEPGQNTVYEKWNLPHVDGVAVNAKEIDKRREEQGLEPLEEQECLLPKPPTPEELQAIRDAAYKEGYDQGRQEALLKTEGQAKKLEQQMRELLGQMTAPLDAMDDMAEKQLVKLAILLAKQIVRREMSIDPGNVIAVVRESIALLPSGHQKIDLYLHPEDALLVKDSFHVKPSNEDNWQILDDPSMTRGDCRVVSGHATIDAGLETRMAKITADLLGSQREPEKSE